MHWFVIVYAHQFNLMHEISTLEMLNQHRRLKQTSNARCQKKTSYIYQDIFVFHWFESNNHVKVPKGSKWDPIVVKQSSTYKLFVFVSPLHDSLHLMHGAQAIHMLHILCSYCLESSVRNITLPRLPNHLLPRPYINLFDTDWVPCLVWNPLSKKWCWYVKGGFSSTSIYVTHPLWI